MELGVRLKRNYNDRGVHICHTVRVRVRVRIGVKIRIRVLFSVEVSKAK